MLTIWCNAKFSGSALSLLKSGLEKHRLLFSAQLSSSNLAAGSPDPALAEADVAFGQPDPVGAVQSPRLKWIQLTTAGYTRYDTDEFRTALAAKQAKLTNSSQVYDQPCAEHILAFMLAQARQLPQCLDAQSARSWESAKHRANCRLLQNQNVLLLGFGAIARRLAQLLTPFDASVKAFRRKSADAESRVQIIGSDELDDAINNADHVVNILPDNPVTRGFMSKERFTRMKNGATFYNIGRGTTVDQEALLAALRSGQVGAAYLDVTNPEPLPPEHPLWTTPNCFITPHTAGGFDDEDDALVRHFLANLDRFVSGDELKDKVF